LSQTSVDIRISLSENFTQPEYDEARKVFESFGSVDTKTYFRAAADAQTLFVIVIITFTLGNIATGFFTKMGEDAYDNLKSAIATFLARRRHPTKETVTEIKFPFDSFTVRAFLETEETNEAKEALTKSKQILDLLTEGRSSNSLPSPLTEIELKYDKTTKRWKFSAALNFSADEFAKYVFNEESSSWETIWNRRR
jgi:hypothetical protein